MKLIGILWGNTGTVDVFNFINNFRSNSRERDNDRTLSQIN